METLLGLLVGIGLSAACGFRVFVPLFVVSLGTWTGHITPAASFRWVGSTPALVAFSTATLVEVVGYLIPYVDHLLDVLSVPLAVVAGTVLTAGMVSDLSPFLRWSLALIAGGTVAGGTSALLATARAGLTATTGGCVNPLFALLESALALCAALLAVTVPLLAIVLIGGGVLALTTIAKGLIKQDHKPETVEPELN